MSAGCGACRGCGAFTGSRPGASEPRLDEHKLCGLLWNSWLKPVALAVAMGAACMSFSAGEMASVLLVSLAFGVGLLTCARDSRGQDGAGWKIRVPGQ